MITAGLTNISESINLDLLLKKILWTIQKKGNAR
jgi:hypothetical protein